MLFIYLTNTNKKARVDSRDVDHLNEHSWYLNNSGYAARRGRVGKSFRTILMHREILGTPDNMITDHINGDKLDNRRRNLRIATHSQNQHNRTKYSNNTSGFKGVEWHVRAKKWVARIVYQRKHIHLGCFTNKTQAAKAYDTAARKYHGSFARLNFPIQN